MARRDQEHTELPYPNGWFAVAFSRDLIPGEVKSVHYFGEDLVVFRNRSGEPRVVDAYCPHLGAHLGEGGRVIGDSIRCPFHGWQYDGSTGECVRIPYCERIPSAAKVKAWEVQEKNGMIFVWYHDRGEPPQWDFPALEEIGADGWTEPRAHAVEIPAHVQDTHENNNDPVHFQVVHGMIETPPSTTEWIDDRVYRATMRCEQDLPGGGKFPYDVVRDSWGMGLVSLRFVGIPDAGLLMFSATTPIERERVISRWLMTATTNMVDVAGEEFMAGLTEGVLQDLPVWTNKVHRARPVLCEADESLAEYRRWARQFYSDPQ